MAIEVISIGSSSSGNSYIIKAGRTTLIVDIGLTMKAILEGLKSNDIEPEDVSAVLITHEHVDHVKSVRAIARKCPNATFYASRGTIENTKNFQYVPDDRIATVGAGEIIDFGSIIITSFELSHDAAEPLGYSIEATEEAQLEGEKPGREKLTIVTDTGIVTDEMYEVMKDSDLLILEANHDEELLMFGEYPYSLKVRIKGDHGHLSNAYAGHVLVKMLKERFPEVTGEEEPAEAESADSVAEAEPGICPGVKPLYVMLAHLSDHNNAPFYARHTIEDILTSYGFERDVHYKMTIAAKEVQTCMFADN